MMGTKRTEKACATRKQLLEAALAVIGEKGYSAATVEMCIRDRARRTGWATST